MKNGIIILLIISSLASCKKKENKDINDYPHFTTQQILDSVGFDYEEKYVVFVGPDKTNDTVIFHADHTITEIKHGKDTIIFKVAITSKDTTILNNNQPFRRFYFYFSAPIDTLRYVEFAPANTLFFFMPKIIEGKIELLQPTKSSNIVSNVNLYFYKASEL